MFFRELIKRTAVYLVGTLAIALLACEVRSGSSASPSETTADIPAKPDDAVKDTALPPKPTAESYSPETGLAVYNDLVAATKKYHVFTKQTEKNLGLKWEDQLPRMKEEFSSVQSRKDLMRAINHFANSLKNPHSYYNTPDRPHYLTPGFEIAVEWIATKPQFYVAKIDESDLTDRLQPGDLVASFQGIDAADFLTAFHLESNGNNWRSIARNIADFFSRQSPEKHGTQPGDLAEWTFRKRKSGETVTIRAQWKESPGSRHSREFEIKYEPTTCADLPERNYGADYSITQIGTTYCVYTAAQGQSRHYPIVRQFSFMYSGRHVFSSLKADHENLKRFLGKLKGIKGVVLDLRDNRGGNNPNWFLDWWAPASYYDHFVFARLHQDLDSVDRLRRANITGWGPDEFQIYLDTLAKRAPGTNFMGPRPFFCPTADCTDWDNLYHPKNQVTALPVALLVGPRCVSSCDHLVFVFRENGFGPVIGTAGSAGYTVFRLKHRVKHPRTGRDLGFVALAFSYETSGKTGQEVEAVIVAPDYEIEPTFENREQYDRLLVNAAIESFGSFQFPKPFQ